MTVYGEVLFAENFITGAVILVLTGRLRGVKTGKWRIAAGAAMCGIYAFILFVPLNWPVALAGKLLFSAAVAVAVFGSGTWRSILKTAGAFYIVSFLMGGVTIALMYILNVPGMTGNGSFVLKGVTFFQITAGVTVTWYLGSRLAELLRENVIRRRVIRRVTVRISGNEWEMNAMIDTGNSLNDPVTGWPVAVLSKDAAEEICRVCDSEQFTKFSAIPYRTAGRAGIMFGMRPDALVIDGSCVTDIILGFSERNFAPWRGTEKYNLLLHQQFLEGEEQDYGEKCDYDSRSRRI